MIVNKTKNTLVSKDFVKKDGFGAIKGLIGEKRAKTIVFKTRFGIHTFLLKYPIDILILDKNKKIVKAKRSLLPNRIFVWNVKFDTVIELPSQTLKNSNTSVGDVLGFES